VWSAESSDRRREHTGNSNHVGHNGVPRFKVVQVGFGNSRFHTEQNRVFNERLIPRSKIFQGVPVGAKCAVVLDVGPR
jgi:hypothetical protein